MILYYFFVFLVTAAAAATAMMVARRPKEHFLGEKMPLSAAQIAQQNTILNNQQLAEQQQKDKYVADYKQVVSSAAAAAALPPAPAPAPATAPAPLTAPPTAPPTAYKDPKDMTADELRRFKRLTIFDNMTVQDYKNWLLLYKSDYYLLGDENLLNLRNLLRGETLSLRDIPNGLTDLINNNNNNTQKYYARMYDQLARTEQILTPIRSSLRPGQVGYNYNNYSEFAAPVAMPQLRVSNGQVELQYRRPRRNQEGKKVVTIPLEDVVAPYPVSPTM